MADSRRRRRQVSFGALWLALFPACSATAFLLGPFSATLAPTRKVTIRYPQQFAKNNFTATVLTHSNAISLTSRSPLFHQPTVSLPTPPKISAATVPSRRTLTILSSVLAVNSGLLNGVALSGALGCAQAVSACTGAYTSLAAATVSSGTATPFVFLYSILSYLTGSAMNGVMCPHGVNWQSRVPAKSLLVAAALTAMTIGLQSARYSSSVLSAPPRILLYILTAVCGIQTSFTSMLVSGNLLRTCHFSGITSDVGTILGQTLRGNFENTWKIRFWGLLLGSFCVGGLLAQQHTTTTSLWLPVVSYLLVAATVSVRQRFFAET